MRQADIQWGPQDSAFRGQHNKGKLDQWQLPCGQRPHFAAFASSFCRLCTPRTAPPRVLRLVSALFRSAQDRRNTSFLLMMVPPACRDKNRGSCIHGGAKQEERCGGREGGAGGGQWQRVVLEAEVEAAALWSLGSEVLALTVEPHPVAPETC